MTYRSQYIKASIPVENSEESLFKIQDFLLNTFPRGLDGQVLGILGVFCSDINEKNQLLGELIGSETWAATDGLERGLYHTYQGILMSRTKGMFPLILIELQSEKYNPEILCLMICDTILITMMMIELEGFDTKTLVDMISRIFSNSEGKMNCSVPKHIIFVLDGIPGFKILSEKVGMFQKSLKENWEIRNPDQELSEYLLIEFIALSPKKEKIGNLRKRLLYPESDEFIFLDDVEQNIFVLPSLLEQCKNALEREEEFLDLEEKKRNAFGNQLNFFENMLTRPHFDLFSQYRKNVLKNQIVDLRVENDNFLNSLQNSFDPYIKYCPDDIKEILQNRLKFIETSISQEFKELSDLQRASICEKGLAEFDKNLQKSKTLDDVHKFQNTTLEEIHKNLLKTIDPRISNTIESLETELSQKSSKFIITFLEKSFESTQKEIQNETTKIIKKNIENPQCEFWNTIEKELIDVEKRYRLKIIDFETKWKQRSNLDIYKIIEDSKQIEFNKNRARILIIMKEKWNKYVTDEFHKSISNGESENIALEKLKSHFLDKEKEFFEILESIKGTTKNNKNWISNEEFKVIKRDLQAMIERDKSDVRIKFTSIKKSRKFKNQILNGIWIACFIFSFLIPEEKDTFMAIRIVLWGLIGFASVYSNGLLKDKKDLKSILKLFKLIAEE